ncbi:MAG: zinc ribbon domain-containing protein [Clostridia bacterium]|nr:zinc ribbon domain-containing protein [Clostridia bacterium]
MTWWGILLIVLGGLGIVFGLTVLGRRLIQFFGGFLRGLFSELALMPAMESESEKPRSLSSMESVLLPQVLRDFPEYNSALIAERVTRDAVAYYQSGIEGKPCFADGTVQSFLEAFSSSLPSDVQGGIAVHRVALHAYEIAGLDRMLTYQAAVQFTDTAGAVRQRRLVLKYIAAYTDNPAAEVKTFNCPNCGAPLPIVGSKECRYCGTALKTPAGLGWMLFDAHEG